MKVEITTRAEEFYDEYDYRNFCRITVNGKEEFSVSDGEPEDSNLSRDFSEVHNIDALMEMAYAAGMNKEKLEFTYTQAEY
jgi:hypothetical protein